MASRYFLTVVHCPECEEWYGAEMTIEETGHGICYCHTCGFFSSFFREEFVGIKPRKEKFTYFPRPFSQEGGMSGNTND